MSVAQYLQHEQDGHIRQLYWQEWKHQHTGQQSCWRRVGMVDSMRGVWALQQGAVFTFSSAASNTCYARTDSIAAVKHLQLRYANSDMIVYYGRLVVQTRIVAAVAVLTRGSRRSP